MIFIVHKYFLSATEYFLLRTWMGVIVQNLESITGFHLPHRLFRLRSGVGVVVVVVVVAIFMMQ